MQPVQLLQPRFQVLVPRLLDRVPSLQLERPSNLVDPALNLSVQEECDKEVLDFGRGDGELLAEPAEIHPGVGLDEVDEVLDSERAEDLVDVALDEGVVEDCRLVLAKNLLRVVDVATLVGRNEVSEADDLAIVLVSA
jgi:hypothetical protein